MVDVADGRHFSNTWLHEDPSVLQMNDSWKQSLAAKVSGLVSTLTEQTDKLSSSDISMYTGLAGIGLFYHRLSTYSGDLLAPGVRLNAQNVVSKIVRRCLRHVDKERLRKNVSIFTSSTGALCLATLVLRSSDKDLSADCLKQLLSFVKYTLSVDSQMPDEALYGRTGYLNALLLLKEEAQCEIPMDIIKTVVDTILQSGIATATRYQSEQIYSDLMRQAENGSNLTMPPLMYEWHGKAYLGGAHGFAGILLTLLKIFQMNEQLLDSATLHKLVLPTVQWLANLQFDSGNWPSSLGSSLQRDTLVHWCHGATGIVPLMLAAYQITKDDSYLKRAVRGGESIWSRGMLHKGCGLCHGSAGTGYVFLDLYRVTRDSKYLYRAARFAEWCTDCFKNRTRVADRPYSLFEGLAGTLYFLLDMLDPTNARFPILNGI